jgi:hypothetical protein
MRHSLKMDKTQIVDLTYSHKRIICIVISKGVDLFVKPSMLYCFSYWQMVFGRSLVDICLNSPTTTPSPTSSSSSQGTITVINKNVFEGREPIGSSSPSSSSAVTCSSGSTLTAKPFPEFNNPANAAAGLVITDTTMTKNQPASGGQLNITGQIQNIRPASAATGTTGPTTTTTTAEAAAATTTPPPPTTTNNINDIINTAAMVVVEATFFDKANNVVEVKNIAAEPNRLGPGESGTFHIIVNDPASNNVAKATYLAQWVGVDSAGNQVLLDPTAEELQAAATPPASTSTTTTTAPPDAATTTTTTATTTTSPSTIE